MAVKLRFGSGHSNSKLTKWKNLHTFSLPAGHTCPFALICRSRVDRVDGRLKIVDGPHTTVRCFAATSEVRSTNVYKRNQFNHEVLLGAGIIDTSALTKLLDRSIPAGADYIRIHAIGGDFLTEEYMLAWVDVAKQYPETIFYGYTKALPYYKTLKHLFPPNFRLSPSRGGTHDHIIDEEGFPIYIETAFWQPKYERHLLRMQPQC